MTANSGNNMLRKIVIVVMSLIASIYVGWLLSHWGIIFGIVVGGALFVISVYSGMKNPNSFFKQW